MPAVLLIALLVFTLCGCGETLVELTDEEAESIVAYSAHVISKYNKRQPDGISRVFIPEEEETEEETEESAEQEPEEASEDLEKPEGDFYQNPEEPEEEQQTMPVVSLSDFVGRPDLSMQWTSTLVTQNYVSNDAMSVSSGAEEAYVVLKVEIANPGTEDAELNMLELSPDFKLWVNGDKRIPFSLTILPSDFPTYVGTIPAGETVETEIFFKRSLSEITDADLYALEVIMNGESGCVEKKDSVEQ